MQSALLKIDNFNASKQHTINNASTRMTEFIDIFNKEISNEEKLSLINDRINEQYIDRIWIDSSYDVLTLNFNLLAKALTNEKIKTLWLCSERVTIEEICVIGQNLLNSKITGLYIMGSSSDKMLTIIEELINSSITHLKIYSRKNMQKCVSAMGNFKNSFVTHIDLSDNDFVNDENISLVLKYLGTNPIKSLRMSRCGLDGEKIKLIFQQTNTWSQIKKLDLSDNNIANMDEIEFMTNNLKHSSITHLNLSQNVIDEKGIVIILESLKGTHITSLNLNSSRINKNNIDAVVRTLKETSLIKLNIGNCIGLSESNNHLLNCIDTWSTITHLNISGNAMRPESLDILCANISRSAITRLHMGRNNIGDDGVKIIASNLNNLVDLDISDCKLTMKLLQELFDKAEQYCALKFI